MLEIRKPRSGAEWEELSEMRYDLLHKYLGFPKQRIVKGPSKISLLAFSGKKIVGTGTLIVEGKLGHIRYVAVERKSRHRKIGSRLVKRLEQVAKKKKLKMVYVNARKHAKKFFKELDFETKGDYFKHKKIGTLHIRMEKIL
ncbi:MAG: GNAT family N-acetyltransferase [archaeon]|jgi:N-acetylglutamate synthase-like GNAT family acetyltransferase|nr:GNAT family N-acetyltransferase [archaeon]